MSIIFSAILPHPPMLIEKIGKENLIKLKQTVAAYEKIKKGLLAEIPDVIFIISPHGYIQDDAFTLNYAREYFANFEEFGDFSTKTSFKSDIELVYSLEEALETDAKIQVISQPELDHGSSVPLCLLADGLPNIRIIPLYYSGLGLSEHFRMGQLLNYELHKTIKKIAVIASGDLSHTLAKGSPAGYNPKGKKFDKKLIELLAKNEINEIIELDEDLIENACECGLRSIVILLGIINGFKYEPKLLSYEAPFGVGYMVMNFSF